VRIEKQLYTILDAINILKASNDGQRGRGGISAYLKKIVHLLKW
jgi:hypothetical protein